MFSTFWKTGELIKSKTSAIPAFFISHASLQNKNNTLSLQIQDLEIKNLISEYLYDENEELRKILNRLDEKEAIITSIIARPNQSLYDTFIIDLGMDNISIGDIAMANGNITIGRVAEVYDKTSKVVLFSSFGEKIDVLVGKQKISAIAIGRNGGNFEIRFPRDMEITIGDIVSVPSMDIRILGVVAHIQKEANDPFQAVLIQSPVNIFELKWLEIIKNNINNINESE